MYDNDSKGISYTAGFFILLAFVIAGLMVASLLSGQVWVAMTGKSLETLTKGVFTPSDSSALKLIQSINAVAGFFLPTVLTASLLNRRPFHLIGLSSGPARINQIGLVVLIIAAGLVVSSSLSYFTNQIPLTQAMRLRFDKMEEMYNQQVSGILTLHSVGDYILSLAIMAFLPALCEETVFRGGFQNFLARGTGRPWLSIILVSILFSLAHWSFYGFFSRFFLGIILGSLYYYSGKLWLSVLAHFLNNALAITVLFVYTKQGKPLSEAMRDDNASFWGILALPIVIGLVLAFVRVSSTNRRIA